MIFPDRPATVRDNVLKLLNSEFPPNNDSKESTKQKADLMLILSNRALEDFYGNEDYRERQKDIMLTCGTQLAQLAGVRAGIVGLNLSKAIRPRWSPSFCFSSSPVFYSFLPSNSAFSLLSFLPLSSTGVFSLLSSFSSTFFFPSSVFQLLSAHFPPIRNILNSSSSRSHPSSR